MAPEEAQQYDNSNYFNVRMFRVYPIRLHRTGTGVEEAEWAVAGEGRNVAMWDVIDVGAVDDRLLLLRERSREPPPRRRR